MTANSYFTLGKQHDFFFELTLFLEEPVVFQKHWW